MEKKYYKHKIEKLIVVDDIVTIHYFELSKDFTYPNEAHDFWEIIYADKNSCIVRTEDAEISLAEGEIAFIKPNKPHSLAANGIEAPNVFITSFVCKSRAIHFFEDKKVKVPKNLIRFMYLVTDEGKKTFNLPYFDPNMTKMELLQNPELGGEQLIKNYLEILLINIMRNETESESSDAVFLQMDEGEVTTRVIAYMKSHLGEKLTIEEICENVHYNKSYIFRIFKRETGKTPMDYFVRLKVERAKQLLREGNLNIAQIAENLAFDTANYFSKTFKKIAGTTPASYKARHSSK